MKARNLGRERNYRPKRTLGDGEAGTKQKLRNLSDEALGVLGAVIPQHVLGNGGVADDDEVPGARGEAVDGAVLVHPLEERQEEGAAEKIGDVVELGAGGGDVGVVFGA